MKCTFFEGHCGEDKYLPFSAGLAAQLRVETDKRDLQGDWHMNLLLERRTRHSVEIKLTRDPRIEIDTTCQLTDSPEEISFIAENLVRIMKRHEPRAPKGGKSGETA